MTAPQITIEENPDPGLRDSIVKPLRAFNNSQVGELRSQDLAILLRDPRSGEITGGLWGRSVADWLFVDLLFVPDQLRKQGIGSAIMKKAEEVAAARNCVGLWLHTGTFQAPGFYEKLGYLPFGSIDDYPRGYQTIYYCKRLEA